MSNISGKAYAMKVVTPMKPWVTWVNRLLFMGARSLPARLGGLLGLSLIHFARWAIIKRDQWSNPGGGNDNDLHNDYMLFCSNFNGTWDQYIDAFSDGIPSGLDAFWFSSTKYPESIPVTAFKNYITHNQIDTDYYYNATPGSAQRDVKCALKVYVALLELAHKHKSGDPEAFARSYLVALGNVQTCLGEPGYGPVASLDTEYADENRRKFIDKMWPST